jgi:chromatin modification-related protein VID21
LSAIEPTVESKLLAESDNEVGRTSIDSQGVDPKLDTVSGEVPTVVSKGSQMGILTSADLEGRTTANLLQPPSVSVSDSTTAQYPASPGRTSLHASSIASTSQIISLPTAIGIASPLAPVASSIPSLPSSQVEASNVTSSRPSLHNTDLAPPPLDIAAISDQYAALLPLLPADLLRIRLSAPARTSASGSRKGKEKVTSNGGPDLWRMNVKAVHTGARNFLGKGKRVHNVMSTSDWSVAEEEVRGLRAFERIEQVKAEKAWSFRQPKKQRAGTAPKAHWDHLLDEMVSHCPR